MTAKLSQLLEGMKESGRKAEEFEKYIRTPEGIKEVIKYIIDARTGGCPKMYYPKQRTETERAIYDAILELRKEMKFE